MIRKLKPRVSEVCCSDPCNLVLSISLADQRSILLEVRRTTRGLTFDICGSIVERKNNTKQLEHYSLQLKFYYQSTSHRTLSTGDTDDLNGRLIINKLRYSKAGIIGYNYFTKLISASGIRQNKKVVQRIVARSWFRKSSKSRHFNRQRTNQHKIVGCNTLLFGIPKRVPDTLFWRPLGLRLLSEMKNYVRQHQLGGHYDEIVTPVLLSKDFWLRSGHSTNYGENMLGTSGNTGYVIKPMNCIGHICAYKYYQRSFRDLPLRFAEFGVCHRKEASGAIYGLLRTKGFTQDDAHVFCSKSQVKEEIETLHKATINTYITFGFRNVYVKLSYPNNFSTNWSLIILRDVLTKYNTVFEEAPGDGAFYGAKIEYHLTDHSGHLWQCGTLQLDEILPKNMGLLFIEPNGKRSRPVILHRAMLGSFERFIGVLLEHRRKTPVWLTPIEVMLLSVTNVSTYKFLTIRILSKVKVHHYEDSTDRGVGYRLNKHSLKRIPYIILLGERERTMMVLSVRARVPGYHEIFTLESFIHLVSFKNHQLENEEDI